MPIYNAKNPLEELTTTKYQFQSLTYPLDLDDLSSFGHYMNFYINVSKNSKYLAGSQYNTGSYLLSSYDQETGNEISIDPQTNRAVEGNWNTVYRSAYGSRFPSGAYTTDPGVTIGGFAGTPNPFGGAAGGNAGSITSIPYTRISQAISLYIPDSMNFASSYDWQEASLTDAGGKALKYGQLAGGAISAGGDFMKSGAMEGMRHMGVLSDVLLGGTSGGAPSLGDIGLGIGGLAVNPQIFCLFRGVDLRTFQFDFIFSPKSKEEAANVRQIIKAFRFHAAPEIDAYSGRYFIPPSIFNLEYMYAPIGLNNDPNKVNTGKPNENIFRVQTLILQKLAVDYAPFGWSTYNDGMPIQTHLSLVFKETEILTKAKVNRGY